MKCHNSNWKFPICRGDGGVDGVEPYNYAPYTIKVLITAPKNLILIFSWRFYWSQKILLKSLVALKLGWRLVNRTLHTKAQRFLFSKRRFKKFSTAVGAINRAQQSSLTSKWRLN